MTDMLRQGQAWLADQLGAHASREIVYRRGGLSAMLVATIGKSEYEQDSQDGHIIRRQVRDFLNETMVLWLQERQSSGKSLVWTEVCLDNRDLALAIRQRFGSWIRALEAAGLAERA